VFSRIERGIGEELLQYEAMTGLNDGQLTDLDHSRGLQARSWAGLW
jgi:hypothetical protein